MVFGPTYYHFSLFTLPSLPELDRSLLHVEGGVNRSHDNWRGGHDDASDDAHYTISVAVLYARRPAHDRDDSQYEDDSHDNNDYRKEFLHDIRRVKGEDRYKGRYLLARSYIYPQCCDAHFVFYVLGACMILLIGHQISA